MIILDICIPPLRLRLILMEHGTRIWSFAHIVRALRILLFGFWGLQRASVPQLYFTTSIMSQITATSFSVRSSIWSITYLRHVLFCRNQRPRDLLGHSLEANISSNNDELVVDNKYAQGRELPPIPFLQWRSQAINYYIRGNSDGMEYAYLYDQHLHTTCLRFMQ